MSQRAVTSLNWTTDILKKISIKIMWKKRDISQRKKRKGRIILVIEKKREREREYWEERKEESTLRKKRLGTRYVFFPFCLYIHSWHKIKKKHPQLFLFYPHASPWTHNSTRFLHCVFALHLHRTSHHESPSPFHSIPIIINQTTFYAMLTPLSKYTNQISSK